MSKIRKGFWERLDPYEAGLFTAALVSVLIDGVAMYALLAQLIVIAAAFDARKLGGVS